VLEQVRPTEEAVDVRFEGADHGPYHLHPILPQSDKDDLTFVRALPIAVAADAAAEILIAYEMNGEPLRPDHGAPFRLIVPHWFAVASVKWLHRIDVLTSPYAGEFQTGHYIYEWPDRPHEPVTLMRVRARITNPAPGAVLAPGTHTVRGKAWSGTGPITNVDLSFTGEGEWHPARLHPPRGPYEWQDWTFEWDAADVGRHSLRARATDAAGNVQPEVPPWNRLGYGNNAIEVSYVDVG
jgi:DMSO/TMAO reductase YedYZ molybdopterin-dependent catalytic subunit